MVVVLSQPGQTPQRNGHTIQQRQALLLLATVEFGSPFAKIQKGRRLDCRGLSLRQKLASISLQRPSVCFGSAEIDGSKALVLSATVLSALS